MHLDLRLNDLPMPRIAAIRLDGPTRILQEITSRNLVKATQGGESRQFQNRKEKMKQRLVERGEHVTFEQATNESVGVVCCSASICSMQQTPMRLGSRPLMKLSLPLC